MAERTAAPGGLEAVIAFVNTVDLESGKDALRSPGALRDTLVELCILEPDVEPDAQDLARAREVREAIRVLLERNCGHECDVAAIATLNEAAGRSTLQLRFDTDGDSKLVPCGGGVDAAIGTLLGVVFTSMADGTWDRMKACHRDSCRWAFYDRSKNRSRSWCSMDVCGNKEKAKAYRARHGHD